MGIPAVRRNAESAKRWCDNAFLVVEAAVIVAIASAAIRWLPFRRVMAQAGRVGDGTTRHDRGSKARQIRWAVNYSSDRVPWRAVCFQRGLAMHWMARRRGIDTFLHYGIDGHSDERLSAHVWVELDGRPVMGEGDRSRHTSVLIRPDPSVAWH